MEQKVFMQTTGYNFEGYTIKDYIEVISTQSGGHSSVFTYKGKLEDSYLEAKYNLIDKAKSCGANALIGISFNYVHVSDLIIIVSATGTAVKIEKNTNN